MYSKEKAFEEIKKNLPEFYKEYFIDDGLLQTLTVSTMHAIDLVTSYVIDTFSNNNIKSAETFRTIPYIGFNASDAFYTYNSIASTPKINFLLGISSSYTHEEIIEFWKFTAPPNLKLAVLDKLGYYIELDTGDLDHTTSLEEIEKRYKGDIVGAELFHQKLRKIEGSEFAIKNNKLYILDMSKFDLTDPYIILRNIQIDYNMVWDRTGSHVGVPYVNSIGMGRVEYNVLNKLFAEIASKGPIIADMNNTIGAMFGEDKANNIGMYDAFLRNNDKSYFWDASATTLPEIDEDGKGVQITGDLIFQYENDILIDDDTAVIEAIVRGIKNYTCAWEYAMNDVWNAFPADQQSDDTLTMPVDSVSFVDRESNIRVVITDTDTNKVYYAYKVVSKIDKLKYMGEAAYMKGKPLSVFDFVVAFPRGFATPGIGDKDTRMDMFARYLDIIKPAYSYFYMSWMEFVDTSTTGGETVKPIDDTIEVVHNYGEELVENIGLSDKLNMILHPDEDSPETNPIYNIRSDYADMFDYCNGIYGDDEFDKWDEPYHEIETSPHDYSIVDHVAIFLNTFPEAPIGLRANYNRTKNVVEIVFMNSGAGISDDTRATYYEIYRDNVHVANFNIGLSNRDKIVIFEDSECPNISNAVYKVRTVYKSNTEGEDRYSHFEETKVAI